MSDSRLADYVDHLQQAALDACAFVDGMVKDRFLADKRTQQAVIMSLVIIGEAATKVMWTGTPILRWHMAKSRGAACAACETGLRTGTLTSTSMLFGKPCRRRCLNCFSNSLPCAGMPTPKADWLRARASVSSGLPHGFAELNRFAS